MSLGCIEVGGCSALLGALFMKVAAMAHHGSRIEMLYGAFLSHGSSLKSSKLDHLRKLKTTATQQQ